MADLLPGGDGEPWVTPLRIPICEISCDWLSALMGPANIAGRLSRGTWRLDS